MVFYGEKEPEIKDNMFQNHVETDQPSTGVGTAVISIKMLQKPDIYKLKGLEKQVLILILQQNL